MKLLLSILFSICLISCYRYEEPTLVSLSGEYIVDKIVVNIVEGPNYGQDTTFLPGDIYVSPTDSFPMDSIHVGFTRWHFDYSVVSFSPYVNQAGQLQWGEQYFYHLEPSYTTYQLGFVDINMMERRLILKIIDDGNESVTFRTTGKWIFPGYWEESSVTLYLSRVGP